MPHVAAPAVVRGGVGQGEDGLERPRGSAGMLTGEPVVERGQAVEEVDGFGQSVDQHQVLFLLVGNGLGGSCRCQGRMR